jgi:hypothetical protein
MSKVTLTFHELSHEQADEILSHARKTFSDLAKRGGEAVVKTPAEVKSPKKTKTAVAPPVEDEVDLGDGETEEVSSDPTLEDVIEALQTYAETNTRDAAKKILASFKVKSVQDLKESDYPKILKKLS